MRLLTKNTCPLRLISKLMARYDFLIKGMHLRLNGITVGRRSLDDRQVARTHQRELQSTGNGVAVMVSVSTFTFNLAEFLFDTNSELLFLINNQQSKIFELNAFADDFMRTDQNIYFPFRQPFHYWKPLPGSGAGTTQIIHLARQILSNARLKV